VEPPELIAREAPGLVKRSRTASEIDRQLTRWELIERFGGWLSGPDRGRNVVDKARW